VLRQSRWFAKGAATAGSERKVGFGQHSELSYEEILKVDPRYCGWVKSKFVKDTEAGESMNPNFKALGDYLQGVDLPASEKASSAKGSFSKGAGASARSSFAGASKSSPGQSKAGASASVNERGQLASGDWLMSFGKHAGSSFAEVYSKDPNYCEYMVNQVLTSDGRVNSTSAAFATYVLHNSLQEVMKQRKES